MNRLLTDVRYGLRMLLKTPGATGTVLIALSLGIGVSALTFSMINGAVLPVLPVDGGDRIVRIERADRASVTAEDYPTWSARQRSFEEFGAFESTNVALAIEGAGASPVSAASITPSVFSVLSVQPEMGRPLTELDAVPGAPAVTLVSHEVWVDRLGSDPNVLGRIVRVDGRPAEVIGVMPEGFGFPWDQQVWSPLPVRADGTVLFTASGEGGSVVGRLREGVSRQAAAEELTALTRSIDQEIGRDAGAESTVSVTNYTDLFGEAGMSAALAALMLGIALLVLLVACANVTNVLLARAIARRREIAVRLAIGASRSRITAQLLVEISLLAALGAAGGVLIATVGTRYVEAVIPPGMPYWIEFRIDWPVLVFVAVVAVLAALMAGLMPALQASRANTNDVLKDSSRGSSSFGLGKVMRRLVGVEMALSVVLLVLAGLFIKSAANFAATEFPFDPEGVYTASVSLPEATYGNEADRTQFLEQVRQRLEALPQVEGVALTTGVPGVGSSGVTPVELEGAAELGGEGAPRTRSIVVTPGFFELFRNSIVGGRDFDARDRDGALQVAIVNEAFARRHFLQGALDRRIRFVGPQGQEEWMTIVGVSQDLMAGGIESEIPEAVYLPLAQNPPSELRILARPLGDFASVAAPIRETLAELDPDIALFDIRSLEAVIAAANSQYTWFSLLFSIAGGIALFLAAIGLYGVMAFWVVQRTREIGVRMALGGKRGDIVRLVLGQGMRQTSVGLIAGVVLAVPAAQLLSAALFGVAPYDPMVFGSIVAVLLAAGWLGCWVPARRATRIDPLKALVAE